MSTGRSVLAIALDPKLLKLPPLGTVAQPALSAEQIITASQADAERLELLGYELQACLIDTGETAESVVQQHLARQRFDCIVLGAGLWTLPEHFLLFEKYCQHRTRAGPARQDRLQ